VRAVPRRHTGEEQVKRNAFLAGPRQPIRVKVCCIASIAEAELALEAGADALGLVSAMPSGPGVISDEDITTIATWIGKHAASVLLTSRVTAHAIAAQLREARPTVLQLTDTLPDDELTLLRERHPEVVLMPVVHVRDEDSVTEAMHLAAHADAILLDSGNPGASVKELGGTGRVHDWAVSRAICDAVDLPVFLAGGLKPENVGDAVRTVQPFGVDVCSGVRIGGKLDRGLLSEFVAAARAQN
jgi:phosphoribosylanthranilate isomerase